MAPPASAQVVVVGGGVMGASALYHLAKAGCTDAVLVERETLAAGSTSKAAGGIRAQFSDALNIQVSLECIRRVRALRRRARRGNRLQAVGLPLPPHVDGARSTPFAARVDLQQELGVPSRLLHPARPPRSCRVSRSDDVLAATYCPIDGYATPEAAVQGYASAATALGASIAQGCRATSIDVEAGRVVAVDTDQGRIATERVIVTAGVWSRELGETAG